MPRLHSLELLPDDHGTDVVRRAWQALRHAGLPSMLDHSGGTNTPHVTVLEVPGITDADEALAVDHLGPLLPFEARVSGLAVLGGIRITVAWLLDVPDEVLAAVLRVRAGTTGHRHAGWLPHVTLARRLDRRDLQRAVDALEAVQNDAAGTLGLTGLRRWDPDAEEVRALWPPQQPPPTPPTR